MGLVVKFQQNKHNNKKLPELKDFVSGLLFENKYAGSNMINMKRNVVMMRFLFVGFIAVLLSACGSSRRTFGLEEGWELLGERKVNFLRDKDVMEVSSRNQFTAIRFYVEDKDVRINDLKIQFENGDRVEPALDDVIAAGQQSRVIELAADGRRITSIEFKYRSMGSVLEGRANVVVTGRRYNPYGAY